MSILLWVNAFCAALAVFFMLLVLRGVYSHIIAVRHDGKVKSLREMSAGDWMRLGVGMYHIKSLVRIFVWDLIILLMVWNRVWWASSINITLSSIAIMGSIAILIAMYKNIPDEFRNHYNVLTAPWFPSPPPSTFFLDSRDRNKRIQDIKLFVDWSLVSSYNCDKGEDSE